MKETMRRFKLTFADGEEVFQWGYNHDHAIERQMDYLEEIGGAQGEEIVKCVLVSPRK